MFKRTMIKFNQVKEGGDGSASGYEAPPPTTETQPPSAAPSEAPGDHDEFGYKKAPSSEQSGKEGESKADEGKKADEKPASKEEQPDPVSGYSDEPPKVEESKEEVPPAPEQKKDDDKPKDEGLGYELETKDLDPKLAEQIKNFAKNYKLSEDAAKAFVEMKKAEIQAVKKAEIDSQIAEKKALTEIKMQWHKELKEDPNFGGKNFVRNIHKVDKLLNQFMPETKKNLTERKAMLPPIVMRDLSKLADVIFSTENLVHGDLNTSANETEENDEDAHLKFYKT